MTNSRGRPRTFNEEKVLKAAEQVFWKKGFSDTSLDDLVGAMGINRPSIYRAFGSKEDIYRRLLQNFADKMEAVFIETMGSDGNIRDRLIAFYQNALTVYSGGGIAKGCMVMSTAVTVAPCNSAIQEDLMAIIQFVDEKLAEQFQIAIDSGHISATPNGKSRGMLAQSLLHSLSLRARAGQSPSQLQPLIETGVALLTS